MVLEIPVPRQFQNSSSPLSLVMATVPSPVYSKRTLVPMLLLQTSKDDGPPERRACANEDRPSLLGRLPWLTASVGRKYSQIGDVTHLVRLAGHLSAHRLLGVRLGRPCDY